MCVVCMLEDVLIIRPGKLLMKTFLDTYSQKFACDESCFVKPQNESSRPPLAEATGRPSLASATLPSVTGAGGLLERMFTPEVCFHGVGFAAQSLACAGGEVGLVRSSSGSCSGILSVGI